MQMFDNKSPKFCWLSAAKQQPPEAFQFLTLRIMQRYWVSPQLPYVVKFIVSLDLPYKVTLVV